MVFHACLPFVFDRAELIDQRAATDPEFLGRVCAIAIAFSKGGKYRRALHLRKPADNTRSAAGGQGGNFWWQVLRQNHVTAAQQARPLNRVTQLTNITWPAVGEQTLNCLRRKPHWSAGEFDGEPAGKRKDVVLSLGERRHNQFNDIDAVVEIITKAAFEHLLAQIAVGSRYQPGIDLERRITADRRDLARFERPEQLGLQMERQLADFIKEECAAICCSKVPFPNLAGPCEGPLGVTEQLAFNKRLRQAGAVCRN